MAGQKPFKNLKPRNIKSKKPHPAGISGKVIKLLNIYTMIAQNKYPSVESITDRLEVGQRTAYRYLEIINLIDPIELDKDRKGYKFLNGNRIKKLALSDDEFYLLMTIGATVSHLGTPFMENFQKIMDSMINVANISSDRNKVPIVVKMPDAIETDKTTSYMKTIAGCIKERRSIDITYKGLRSKKTEERRVDPYGLVFYEGAWILIAYCHLREKIRHFALDRIEDLKEKWHYFKSIDGFDIESHFSHSWGIHDDEDVNVVVRFPAKAADYITRKDKWHPTEKRKILPTGEVELSFTVAGVDEIKRWIYSWLPNVEVVEPKWFREQIKKELSESADKH